MARTPRKEVFQEDEVGIYHCINRCVRRAFLCGRDSYTGKSFEHRKDWIRDRLRQLAGIFGIDVLGFAVLDNHLHVELRNRPDVVASWSDDEVARRWWMLFPQRKDKHGNALEPEDHELQMLLSDANALAERRRRLSHISWFMRCLCETIARRANREDGCSGRFWQGRFRCVSIEDESALLACSVYVDLNPIRAGVAKTPETSQFTSAYERIMARKDRSRRKRTATSPRRQPLGRDAWLSPIPLDERPRSSQQIPQERASNSGFLPLSVDEYLTLLHWTGRQVRRDKAGKIPADLKPILERLQIVSDCWIEMVKNFSRWFRRAAGRPETLASVASRRGRRWLHGMGRSRIAFA